MPKQAINYENTIIYKLVCKDLNVKDLYVGHTTNFKQRKRQHKKSCNFISQKAHTVYVYDFIRKNGGWDNWDMIEVEKSSFKDVFEATARERYWYEELKGTLNACIPARTKKEYYEEHKEKVIQKAKERYEKNKEEILEKAKEKYDCPCGSVFRKNDLTRHKKSQKHQEWEKRQSK